MKIIEKPSLLVTGIIVHANWKQLWNEMPKAWESFFELYESIENKMNSNFMDISLGIENETYSQLICVEVSEHEAAPEQMINYVVPLKKYIHHKHTGKLEGIAESFGKMYTWGKKQKLNTTEFKLDVGYSLSGDENSHDLFIEVV
ncbi:MAG: GyrI-like domain-containing protein [Balneolaceae bacterium]